MTELQLSNGNATYAAAIRAQRQHDRIMQDCTCDWDVNYRGAAVRLPQVGCPVAHYEED